MVGSLVHGNRDIRDRENLAGDLSFKDIDNFYSETGPRYWDDIQLIHCVWQNDLRWELDDPVVTIENVNFRRYLKFVHVQLSIDVT